MNKDLPVSLLSITITNAISAVKPLYT